MDTAHEVGARYGDDGQRWEDADGVLLGDACLEAGAQPRVNEANSSLIRFTFSDGSALTIAGGGWDYGYADCWCWDGTGHDEDCAEELMAVHRETS